MWTDIYISLTFNFGGLDMNKHCALCNLCDCCNLAPEQEKNCIGYTYYANDDESHDMEHGHYRGYAWKIRTNWGQYPSAYVYIPNDNPLYNIVLNDYTDIHVPVHCGLTMGGGTQGNDAIIGWDYGHLGDYQPRHEDEGGKRWLRSEIHKEIDRCIDTLCDLVERKKEEGEEPVEVQVLGEHFKVYRKVSEEQGEIECYECGRRATYGTESPWFTSRELAEKYELDYEYKNTYIQEMSVFKGYDTKVVKRKDLAMYR